MKTSADILEKIKKYYKITYIKLAKKINVHSHTMYRIRQGLEDITPELAEKIVEWQPDINKEWLLSGEGTMLNDADFLVEEEDENEDLHVSTDKIAKTLFHYRHIIDAQQDIIRVQQKQINNLTSVVLSIKISDA